MVGSQNVWLNFIYNPNNVPADAYESNNTAGSATLLTGNDQMLTGGTISQGDVDYYRLLATTTGLMTIDLRFPLANGNLDMRVLDARALRSCKAMRFLLKSSCRQTLSLVGPTTLSSSRRRQGLAVPTHCKSMFPPPKAVEVRPDAITTSTADAPTLIDVLANDRDPDGELSRAQLSIISAGRGSIEIISGSQPKVRYTLHLDSQAWIALVMPSLTHKA